MEKKQQKKITRRRRRSGPSQERQNDRRDSSERPKSCPPTHEFVESLEDSIALQEEPIPFHHESVASASRELEESCSSPKRPRESTPPDTKHRHGALQKVKDMVTFKRSQSSSPSKEGNTKAKEKPYKFPFPKKEKSKSPAGKVKKPEKRKDDPDDMTKHLLDNMEKDSSSSALDSISINFPEVEVEVEKSAEVSGFNNPNMIKAANAPVGWHSDDYVDSQSTESSSLSDAMFRQHISPQKQSVSNLDVEESAEIGVRDLEGCSKSQDAAESVPLLPPQVQKESPPSSDDEDSSETPEKKRKKRKK